MYRVKVGNEIFAGWMTKGHTFLPAQCISGLPRGCEMFRASVTLNGDLEVYLLSPHEVRQIQGGSTIDFNKAMAEAEEVPVTYQKCKVEVSM